MNTKHEYPIMLIVLPLLIVGLLAACSPQKSTAETVAKAASQIVDFDLPAGYQPDLTVHALGYTVVAYNPGDGHSHLYLIQSENETDGDKLADMIAQVTTGQKDPETRTEVIETRAVTLRGQPSTLIISEGVTSEGGVYRTATAAFQGNGGPAMVMLTEPVERWDLKRVDAFLASIR